jgi:NAD(P)-dependent dehydrogenase (short-subunit alcohol dehydrogenase family)
MPGTSPVVLILGAGPKVGLPTAKAFASKGYKVAVAARSLNEAESTDRQLNIKSDFANPDDVVNAFVKVKRKLGIPSVVVYNGRSQHQRTLAECLLNVRSRCRDVRSPKRPVCDPVGCFQARHDGQQH